MALTRGSLRFLLCFFFKDSEKIAPTVEYAHHFYAIIQRVVKRYMTLDRKAAEAGT